MSQQTIKIPDIAAEPSCAAKPPPPPAKQDPVTTYPKPVASQKGPLVMTSVSLTRIPVPSEVPHRLEALRDVIAANRSEILAILTQVGARSAAEYEIDAALATLDGAQAEVERHDPPQVGKIAVFLPSNVVLYSYVLYLAVPCLYADQVVFRPSSQVRDTVAALHEFLSPHHGLPITITLDSQRDFVAGPVMDADVVVFTGTYQNAETIRRELAPEQLMTFMGSGINPVIVAPGADLELACEDIATIRLFNSGQDCLAPDIIWVHADLIDEFLTRMRTILSELRYGPNDCPLSDYSSLSYDSALTAGVTYLMRHREAIHFGGEIDLAGRRLSPTIVVWPSHREARIAEFFAPIFNVCSYTDEACAADVLGSGVYAERALGATVYGMAPRIEAALRRKHTVTVNETLLTIDDGNAPFGGNGPMANYVARGRTLHHEPVLISKAIADHLIEPAVLREVG